MDIHCPKVEKRYGSKSDRSMWYNSNLQKLKQMKRKIERKLKKEPTLYNKVVLKQIKNKYNFRLKTTRRNYFKNKIENEKTNSKDLFKTLKKLTGRKKEKVFPKHKSEAEVSEEMANFYVEKIDKIRNQIKTQNKEVLSQNRMDITPLTDFELIDTDQLKAILQSLNKKSCCLDPAPAEVLSKLFSTLHPIFLNIINSSISQNTFPASSKNAVIIPTVKDKSGDRDKYNNYRPLCNLPFLSKPVEKMINIQLQNHMEQNNLHCPNQSAYRKLHSCETAMVEVVSDIQQGISKKNCVALITLDMSSAFDTVDHQLLLQKLEKQFFIHGNALSLLESYIKGRTFFVSINGKTSNKKDLKFGVPQGSLLGPLLFIMYTSDIHNIFKKHGLSYHMYADDIQIYCSFKIEDLNIIKDKIDLCLADVHTWTQNNYLKLNPDKTTLKLFNYSNLDQIFTINYNHSVIEPLNSTKVLGVMLNKDLDRNLFIANKVKICNYHLKNLWNIESSLTKFSKIILITNLILSNIDYCNILLFGCTKKELRPLNLIINKFVRFICEVPRQDHITPYLKQLHFLPLQQRIIYKVCLLGFKIFNNISPGYLTQHFSRFEPSTDINLRNVGRDIFMFETDMNDYRTKNIIAGVKLEWNKLPVTMREEKSLSLFKKHLKTYLYRIAFE